MHGHPFRSMYWRSQSGHANVYCSDSESATSSDVGMALPGRSPWMFRKNSARSRASSGCTKWSAVAQFWSLWRLRQKHAFHLGHRWNLKYAAPASCRAEPTMYRATCPRRGPRDRVRSRSRPAWGYSLGPSASLAFEPCVAYEEREEHDEHEDGAHHVHVDTLLLEEALSEARLKRVSCREAWGPLLLA